MNDQDDVEAILDKFRDWLEAAHLEADDRADSVADAAQGSGGHPAAPADGFGIINLVEEFTALRHEVKLQTKNGRGLVEQTDTVLAALKAAIEQFRSVEPKEAQAVWTAGKALAEALADLDESIDRGYREIERARQLIAEQSVRALEADLDALHRRRSWIKRRLLGPYHAEVMREVARNGRERFEFFQTFLEGYGLIQKRLRRVMAAEQIERIPCDGRPVDPERMTVLEVTDDPARPPGSVAKELRRGYTWRGRVIRYAEVQAVRSAGPPRIAANGTSALESQDARVDLETDDGPVPVLLDSE
jgi:molecular chaperone GrpE